MRRFSPCKQGESLIRSGRFFWARMRTRPISDSRVGQGAFFWSTSSEESGPLAHHGSASSTSTSPTSHGRCGSDRRDGCSVPDVLKEGALLGAIDLPKATFADGVDK